MLEGLGDEFGPVADGGRHVAGVDEVEGRLEGPGLFGIVDFEFDVVGDPLVVAVLVIFGRRGSDWG